MMVKKDQDRNKNGKPEKPVTNGRGGNNAQTIEAEESSSTAANAQAEA